VFKERNKEGWKNIEKRREKKRVGWKKKGEEGR
jgi:hypothetical protein